MSVHSEVLTDKACKAPDGANMWGKLSSRGNDKDVRDLQIPSLVVNPKNDVHQAKETRFASKNTSPHSRKLKLTCG